MQGWPERASRRDSPTHPTDGSATSKADRSISAQREGTTAGAANVAFEGPAWSEGISHGELIRSGVDQTLTIDPCAPLQFLYQGLEAHPPGTEYIEQPYRLGLLTAKTPNPISVMCNKPRPQ